MHTRTFIGSIAVIGTSFLFSALAALPASAHDELVASHPAAGQTLTTLPAEFSVTAHSDLLDLVGDSTGFGIQVTDAAGAFYGDGCLTVAGSTVSTPASLGTAGTYLMVWQFVSGDGHTVSDTLTFTWAPEASFAPSAGSATPPVCGVVAATAVPTAVAATPEPTMSASMGDDDAAGEGSESGQGSAIPLWTGGGILVVVLAAGITLYLARRKNSGSTGSVEEIS
jgi:methionine-rich copper-binding protein CopC